MEQQPLENMLDIRGRVNGTTRVEPWVLDLRARLADAGYDPTQVDGLIMSSVARFQSSKFRDFVPLLVERSVQRALRGD